MKSYMTKLMGGAVLAGGMLAAGCHHGDGYSGHGDPCWPDRYANESRALVVASFQPQVENGHILDQTVWNMHFETGSDKLNGAGMDKLDQLARRRPHPDPRLFVQTARDLPYDPAKPEDYSSKRTDLDSKRVAAVQKYLSTTLTGRPYPFDVQVHDPSYPGIEVGVGTGTRGWATSAVGGQEKGFIAPPTVIGGTLGGMAAGAAGPGGAGAPGGGATGGGAAGGSAPAGPSGSGSTPKN
jgi:hypothetical protein